MLEFLDSREVGDVASPERDCTFALLGEPCALVVLGARHPIGAFVGIERVERNPGRAIRDELQQLVQADQQAPVVIAVSLPRHDAELGRIRPDDEEQSIDLGEPATRLDDLRRLWSSDFVARRGRGQRIAVGPEAEPAGSSTPGAVTAQRPGVAVTGEAELSRFDPRAARRTRLERDGEVHLVDRTGTRHLVGLVAHVRSVAAVRKTLRFSAASDGVRNAVLL